MCADSCRAAPAVGALPSTAEGGPGAEERVQEHTALTRWGGGGRKGGREGEMGGEKPCPYYSIQGSACPAYMYMYM